MNHMSQSKLIVAAALFMSLIFVITGCASKPAAPVQNSFPVSSVPAQKGDVSMTTASANVTPGDNALLPVAGTLVQIGNIGLPSPFGPDSMVFETEYEYWFEGKKTSVPLQVLFGGVIDNGNVSIGDYLDDADIVLGVTSSSEVMLNVRCATFDPYLVLTLLDSGFPPQKIGNWYYFGIGVLQMNTMLDFQPLADADDGYEFWDQPESLREIYEHGYSEYQNGRMSMNSYPRMMFCIQSVLDDYPSSPSVFATELSPATQLLIMRQFPDTQSIGITFDSVPLQVFVNDYMADALAEYYVPGEPVWLYLMADTAVNGELCCYLWDFSSVDPVEYALGASEYIAGYIDIQ